MKKIKEYYQKHKDSIKNAVIVGLTSALTLSIIYVNAADNYIKENIVQKHF